MKNEELVTFYTYNPFINVIPSIDIFYPLEEFLAVYIFCFVAVYCISTASLEPCLACFFEKCSDIMKSVT